MKKRTKIIIIILSILFALFLALAGLFHFYIEPSLTSSLQNAIEENFGENGVDSIKLLEEIEKVLLEEDVQEYINNADPEQSSKLIEIIEGAKENSKPRDTSPQAPSPTPKNYKELYKSLIGTIPPEDIKDALTLAGMVDVGYILNLLSGGLTPAEKSELKVYLMGCLSSQQISRGIELFVKYSYLL